MVSLHSMRRLPLPLAVLVGAIAVAGCGEVEPIRDALGTLTIPSDDDPAAENGGTAATVVVLPASGEPGAPTTGTPTTRAPTDGGQTPASQATSAQPPTTGPVGGDTDNEAPAGARAGTAPVPTTRPRTDGTSEPTPAPAAQSGETPTPTTRSAGTPVSGQREGSPAGADAPRVEVSPEAGADAPRVEVSPEAGADATNPSDTTAPETATGGTPTPSDAAAPEAGADAATPSDTAASGTSGESDPVGAGTSTPGAPVDTAPAGSAAGTASPAPAAAGAAVVDGVLAERVPLDAGDATDRAPLDTVPVGSTDDDRSTDGSEDRGGFGIVDWLVLAAIASAAIAVLLIVTSGSQRQTEVPTAKPSRLQRQLYDVIARAHWIHDRASVDVLGAPNARQTRSRWREIRPRMIRIESRIATIAVGTGVPALDRRLLHLGRCIADLRGAEERYVAAELTATGAATRDQGEQLVQSALEAVLAERRELLAAIEPVAEAIRG